MIRENVEDIAGESVAGSGNIIKSNCLKQEDILRVCLGCKSIDLVGEGDFSFHRSDDSKAYDALIEKYGESRISHGLCRSCMDKFYGPNGSLI